MPVSQISITASHLPSSCSFYLSTLQPLRYQYLGQEVDRIALGVSEADFFLRQELSGHKQSKIQVTFAAENREIVDLFFLAAIKAGGRVEKPPSYPQGHSTGIYSSSVLDLDGNIVECVYTSEGEITLNGLRLGPHDKSGPAITSSKILRTLIEEFGNKSQLKSAICPAEACPEQNLDTLSACRQEPPTLFATSGPLISTILGVAAGAAIAYAWANSKSSSAGEAPEKLKSQPLPQITHESKTPSRQERAPSSTSGKEYDKIGFEDEEKTSGEPGKSDPVQKESETHDKMSAYSRRTIRAIEPPRYTSEYSTTEYVRPLVSRSSSNSQRGSIRSLHTSSQADIVLPRLPQDILLPPSRKGSLISISVTSLPETVRSFRSKPPSAYTKIVTETVVFSPKHRAPESYSLPLSNGSSEASYRSARSRRPESIALPLSVVSSRSPHTRGSDNRIMQTSDRFSGISRPPSISRSYASDSTLKPGPRHRVHRAATDISDVDSLAPSDSISQASSKSRRSRRSSRSKHSSGW